ncbi:MAG: mandelate racemase/muconate lactonizing enzyme family protein [Sedimentisphaerales bacterium]|nr:mandelate racemase/muconate lactonizing enzyme family protein [Sedimentisphaerales bacterium]
MNRRSFLKKTTGFAGMVLTGLAINPAKTFSRPSDLKITDIRGCTVAANYDYPIIKIYTNQDVYGLGEVRDAGSLTTALILKPLLVGKDPLDIESIMETIRPWAGNGRQGGGFSAVDMALFDIAGKTLGVPSYKILGPKIRDKIPIYGDTDANEDAEVYADRAKIRVDKFKLKHLKMDLRPWLVTGKLSGTSGTRGRGGRGGMMGGGMRGTAATEEGLKIWGEYVLAVREAIGYDITLGADHFGSMTVESGIALGEFMAQPQYHLEYIEDVIGYGGQNAVERNKQLCEGSATPSLGFEDLFSFEGYKPFINQGAIDITHCDMLTSGGLLETKRICDYAYRYGVKTMFHCACSPVGAMASVHCACTIPDFISMENHAMDMPWWDDLVTGVPKPLIQDGCYTVPERPGLGIELNDEVVRKYLREPEYLAKTGYFEPTPEFDKPVALDDAQARRMIMGGGSRGMAGPWWHLNEDGEMVYEASAR